MIYVIWLIIDEVPDPPTHIRIESEVLDERIGFFGHVILIVSWNGTQSKKN